MQAVIIRQREVKKGFLYRSRLTYTENKLVVTSVCVCVCVCVCVQYRNRGLEAQTVGCKIGSRVYCTSQGI